MLTINVLHPINFFILPVFYNCLWILRQLRKTRMVVQPSRKYGFGIRRFIIGFLVERKGRIWEILADVPSPVDVWRGSLDKECVGE